INIFLVVLIVLVGKNTYAQFTGIAYIENPQANGLVFSWELHFERTNNWSPGLLTNALGGSAASFDFNNDALANPTINVEPGGPLDNANYPNTTVRIIIDKLIVDIPFMLNALSGQLPLNVKTKLLTVYMDISQPSQTAQLSWDALNTGFFDNADATVITTLTGSSNTPLPVELTSFSASYKNTEIMLGWETKTEVNNYGFNVERRINEGEWNTITFIEGNGNSNSPKEYSYTDKDLFTGGSKFQYRLKQVDTDGSFEYSDAVEVEVVPTQYDLSQNYPNPFNPKTTIQFSLPKQTQLKINIYNMLGELVETLAAGTYEAGYHKVTFNASNLPSGTYIYRMESSNFIQVKKMLLIK
ncbi:MAG TPA: T9SS type A sorting domain-containing protein, partial [Ignavibacteriaceae bacterium]|nr:T9SS type A sorting domain-containing protein [Ignavibacteriaceae bacterium]